MRTLTEKGECIYG